MQRFDYNHPSDRLQLLYTKKRNGSFHSDAKSKNFLFFPAKNYHVCHVPLPAIMGFQGANFAVSFRWKFFDPKNGKTKAMRFPRWHNWHWLPGDIMLLTMRCLEQHHIFARKKGRPGCFGYMLEMKYYQVLVGL